MRTWEDKVHNLCGTSEISFPVTFDPTDNPFARFFKEEPRREFFILEPCGDFVKFTGTIAAGGLSDEGELPVSVSNIEIEERGNLYDKQGSD